MRKNLVQTLGYLSLVVVLAGFRPAVAACQGDWTAASGVVGFSPITLAGPADAVQHGTLIKPGATARVSGWRYFFSEPTQMADCLKLKGRFESLGTVVPGIRYVSNGQVSDVWESGVPGIGYALVMRSEFGPEIGVKEGGIDVIYDKEPVRSSSTSIAVVVALVATGRLASGTYTIPARQVGKYTITDGSGTAKSASIPMASARVTVNAQGCKVISGDGNNVMLPKAITYDFKEVGATSAVSSSFAVGLKCDTTLAVHATLTDASDRANTSNVLSLAPGSTATGFGLQIFRDKSTTPLAFGPESSTKGNLNQWLVGTANAYDTMLIPFTVRYVKTNETVGPGSVNARALITFSYQ
ncbi:type 1 fimbrial protein [Burkholderia pseudomultivorans]|uniref:F17a-G fimbrial adhesin n=1 Tax=Burkholderia pseudomultivorans TaxID=1207504 RepID=A0ABU2E5X1_9BURK|nr:fimbrial protein [Burkholderia pseudomultivorans]MDR8729163.1 F17a-G fimbrial adhesin [Burkholderia pseudomultivorans]MDR8737791.1 F17a-G fimbrial adhesin [Burkholderia pseudomultivorans]MDR8743935.1 F17a-G fimbrial adhesin [Burkholderia pseudomultivorans]MDR8755260.1 F17a-G fimbrial adhesin [Burkholderia pseudomultivorans]MDR8780385.1 F17a-G fimbrial adhesin [Burkholderia pseudomultivorans]